MFQEVLFNEIRKIVSNQSSLIDSTATVLEISYDAAHRRTSLKSKISIDEAILLANHFNISLDKIFGIGMQNFVSVQKTKQITNEEEMQQYFENSYLSLLPLLNKQNSHIYYSAKDIPIFYTLKENTLSRFKIYVWLKLLDKSFRETAFHQFYPKLSTIQSAKKLGELFSNLPTTEIWDVTTINSTLKQIHFYYKAGNLSSETANIICDELIDLLNEISAKVVSTKHSFKLYHNELLLMNNNVLIESENQQLLYVPFTMLSYYLTSDSETCKQAKDYFKKQFKNSKLLNASGEKEQNQFYNKMMQKVHALKELIKVERILDFQ